MTTLSIDPAVLGEQLAAAQAARDHLDRVVAWLAEGVELFAGTVPAEIQQPPEPVADDAPAEEETRQLPAPEPAPPGPTAPIRPSAPRPPVSAGARDFEAKVLSVILQSNRPLTKAEVIAAVDGSDWKIADALRRLVAAGQIAANGATRSRRYGKVGQREFHTEMRTRQEATAARNRGKVEDGVERVVFRDHVAKAIAADSGSLNEERIAQALNAARDDVAEACAWLVEHHQATLNEDGTFSRHAPGRARLRSAA